MKEIKYKEKQFKRASVKAFEKMKQKEVKIDWEKEFDKKFSTTWIKSYTSVIGLNPEAIRGEKVYLVSPGKLKDFIRSLLKAHTSRIVGIVEKLKGEIVGIEIKHKEGFRSWEPNKDLTDGYRKALDDILEAIKGVRNENQNNGFNY